MCVCVCVQIIKDLYLKQEVLAGYRCREQIQPVNHYCTVGNFKWLVEKSLHFNSLILLLCPEHSFEMLVILQIIQDPFPHYLLILLLKEVYINATQWEKMTL